MSRYLDDRLQRIEADPNPIHKALVLGGTGLIGGALLKSLVGRGVRVRAMRRWNSSASHLGALADTVEWVVGDLQEPHALSQAVVGCDVVFLAAGATPFLEGSSVSLVEAVRGVRNVLDVVRDAQLRRLVVVGSPLGLGAPRGGEGFLDASSYGVPLDDDPHVLAAYFQELEVRRAVAVGLPVVTVIPGLCLGPGGPGGGRGRLVSVLGEGHVRVVPDVTFNVIDTRDAAEGIVEAAILGQGGARYLLSGHNVSLWSLARQVAAKCQVGAPLVTVPPSTIRVMGALSPTALRYAARLGPMEILPQVRRRPLEETLDAAVG